MDAKAIKNEIRSHYGEIARQGSSCCAPAGSASSGCCSSEPVNVVPLIDYGIMGVDDPLQGDLGLGCGLPTLSAGIRPGDTVLDLGSGAGVDVFLAAKAVGPQGRVIGVDMTPEMIARAWDNAIKGGYRNVDFRLGEIEALPVADASVDVALSNCVINLAPDKARVFAELYRVLKPGGHFSISDIVTYGDVPQALRQDLVAWAGCVAGALDRDEYLGLIAAAGFVDVRIEKSVDYTQAGEAGYGMLSITVEGRKG